MKDLDGLRSVGNNHEVVERTAHVSLYLLNRAGGRDVAVNRHHVVAHALHERGHVLLAERKPELVFDVDRREFFQPRYCLLPTQEQVVADQCLESDRRFRTFGVDQTLKVAHR